MKMLFYALYSPHSKFPRFIAQHKWQLGNWKWLLKKRGYRIERIILNHKNNTWYDTYKYQRKII